jgi:hypothetical protein
MLAVLNTKNMSGVTRQVLGLAPKTFPEGFENFVFSTTNTSGGSPNLLKGSLAALGNPRGLSVPK